MKIVLIAIGGALGALFRYYTSKIVNSTFSFSFIPWGTVVVNTIGAFVLSFLIFTSIERFEISSNLLLFFGNRIFRCIYYFFYFYIRNFNVIY